MASNAKLHFVYLSDKVILILGATELLRWVDTIEKCS
ncbi:MAG: hypothetical protein ACJAYN_001359 [Bermanella sp.]|jgi:hypothetical protein